MTDPSAHPAIHDDNSVIYVTGYTAEHKPLFGGVWTAWHQNGFPLEMSHMILRDRGDAVDWMEAMADASCSNDLPALMGHIEGFLDTETVNALKMRFVMMLGTGVTYEQIVANKRAGSLRHEQHV